MAADVILHAPDFSAAALQRYGERIAERFGNRASEPAAGWELPEWLKQPLASTLMRSHWFTRKVVTEKWFLHQDVPTLKAVG